MELNEFEGNWVQTFSGLKFHFLQPRTSEINILDIAHSLSNQCRFNGHAQLFYSVAEHCVHASKVCSPQNALWCLLHDAAEAYLGDFTSPIKQSILAGGYVATEKNVQRFIYQKFGLTGQEPAEVKEVDNRMLITEANYLMEHHVRKDWKLQGESLPIDLKCWDPWVAKVKFLDRFIHLKNEVVN